MTDTSAPAEALSREQLLGALVQAESTIEALLRASRRAPRVQASLSHSQQQTVVDFATIQLDTLAFLSPLYRAALARAEAAEARVRELERLAGECQERSAERARRALDVLNATLDRAEAAEAEVKRLRDQQEAVRLVGLKWSQQAAYLQLAHSCQEGDAVVWGSNLDRMQWQMFGHCADELRAALAGSPS